MGVQHMGESKGRARPLVLLWPTSAPPDSAKAIACGAPGGISEGSGKAQDGSAAGTQSQVPQAVLRRSGISRISQAQEPQRCLGRAGQTGACCSLGSRVARFMPHPKGSVKTRSLLFFFDSGRHKRAV